MRLKKALGFFVIALFLLATAGAASAATLDLPKWVIVPEDSSFSDVTLFCPLDAMDTTNNVTPCYVQGSLVNATIYFNSTTGYPKLVSGAILNAFEFDGNDGEGIEVSASLTSQVYSIYAHVEISSLTSTNQLAWVIEDTAGKWNRLQIEPDGDVVLVLYDDAGNIHPYTIKTISTPFTADVLVVVDTSTITVYINDETYTFSKSYDLGDWSNGIFIAHARNLVYVLNGKIDEFRIYTRALSEDEYKLLRFAGRKKLSEPANFRQIFSPMIDLTREKATFYAGLEVSTSDPNGYVPVPESAVNMSITSAEKLKSDYTGADFYYQGHYWYRADKIQFNLPIQFETLREKNSFAKEILLDSDSKTFIYEKEFKVTNPTATKINVLYTVDPTTLGFSVLQYPQFELDGVPMAEWRPSNSTTLYLIRTDSLEPGEISTHWMKSIWTISKEELEFPAKLDDFRSITTFEQARKLAENAVEGKTDTYVKVIKIDSNADVSNVTILVPLKDVEDSSDVIEAVALTGSRETLQVEELPDGKIVVKVPSEAFVSGHAEIKVLYNKEGKSGIFAIISKILAKIKELLRKLGLGGLVLARIWLTRILEVERPCLGS